MFSTRLQGRFWLMLALIAVPRAALALDSIGILVAAPAVANEEFVSELKKELVGQQQGNSPLRISIIKDLAQEKPDLILAVGVQSLSLAAGTSVPVLGVLVPQVSYEKIRAEHARSNASGKFSAIYLDQPLPRQFNLIRAVTPKASSVGVLLGPSTQHQNTALLGAARHHDIGLVLERVDAEQNLVSKLRRTLDESSVLLALPDALVYNRETAQTILLTSYRHEKPVVGFSHAYVKAGALAAVFSTPTQIARQAAEIVRQAIASQQSLLPEPQYPKYFSVDINRQVARSLGINVDEENLIYEKLLKLEKSQP